MKITKGIRSAHGESVNSIFVSFDAGFVISIDGKSIRIWNPVNGNELSRTDMDATEDSVIPGLASIYRLETVAIG